MNKADLLDIDIAPFTKFIWNSHEAREEWSAKLQRVMSLHDKAEYEMVRQGERFCGTLHLNPKNYHEQIDRIQRDNLKWLPIQWTKAYNGFSHKHLPTTPGDPNSSCYGVLARNIEDAEEFRRASGYYGEETNHTVIGKLLGFPSCCSDRFTNNWQDGFFDPMWQSAVATKGAESNENRIVEVEGSIHTNQLLRYFGLRITSHFPCSFDCNESNNIGKTWLEVKKSIDPIATDYLVSILSMPIVWSCLHGIGIIETPIFTIVTNSMPTKERWTILFGVDGGEKPTDAMTLLESDVNLPKIAVDTKKHIRAMKGVMK